MTVLMMVVVVVLIIMWTECFILVCLFLWVMPTGKSSSYYWNIFGFFLLSFLC